MNNTEASWLRALAASGYFEGDSYDPRPVESAARAVLGINSETPEGHAKLVELTNRLIGEGVITFRYSQDPSLHPKDILDHWRIRLTERGAQLIEQAT